MPKIVIVIDELADFNDDGTSRSRTINCSNSSKARACGIHMLVATQRPSVNVITGFNKANIPTYCIYGIFKR